MLERKIGFWRSIVSLGLLALSGGMAHAAELPPLEAYGALPAYEMLRLSPDGTRLAFVTVNGEARTLVLLDMTSKQQFGGAGVGTAKMRDLVWIDNDRVLITTSKTETIPELGIFTRELYSAQIYDASQHGLVEVLKNTRDVFPILFSSAEVVRASEPKVLVRAFAFSNPERLDIFDVDLRHGRGRLSEVMGANVGNFVLDATGQSIARSEYDERGSTWSLYLREGSGFRQAWRVSAPIDMPYLAGLGVNGDSVVVHARRPDLRPGSVDSFWDVNIRTGEWRALRFDFIPDGIIFHPVTRRMIGASRYSDSGTRYIFTDAGAAEVWNAIAQAFNGQNPRLVSWSDDFTRAVVYTQSARDSGTYYAVDLNNGSIVRIGNAYDRISPEQIASVTPIEFDAADGLAIRGYLTVPAGISDPKKLPLVVLPHGGPEANDTLGFDWWAQALASRGYAVLQPNFRGSTGYGPAFVEAGYGEWGRKMQSDLSDGVRYLANQGVIDDAKVCIVGASYGGYAAMAGLALDSDVYRCGVAVAGLSDLRRFVRFQRSRDALRKENTTTRYWNRFMGADGLGDRSLDAISPVHQVANVKAPLLLIHGKDDDVVPFEQSQIMADAMRQAQKTVELVELPGEDHYLSRQETRQRMLAETVRFLSIHNPVD